MKYKFEVGDYVEVIKSGSGFGSDSIGKRFTITSQGEYNSTPRYRCKDKNDILYPNPLYDDFVGEESFKLILDYKRVTKPFYEVPIGGIIESNRSELSVKLGDNRRINLKPSNLGEIVINKNPKRITHIEGVTYEELYTALKETLGINT